MCIHVLRPIGHLDKLVNNDVQTAFLSSNKVYFGISVMDHQRNASLVVWNMSMLPVPNGLGQPFPVR